MKQNIQYVLRKIKEWQEFKYVKSLICRRDGCGIKLEGQERSGRVVLVCPKCRLVQNHVPKSIMEADVSIPDKLKKNQVKSNLFKK